MKKSTVILLHLGFWSCFALLLLILLAALSQGHITGPPIGNIIILISGFAVIPSIMAFYLFSNLLFPKYLKTKKIIPSILSGIVIALSSAIIGALFLSTFLGSNFMFADGFTSFFAELFFMSFISLIIGIIGLIIKGYVTWYEEINLKQELSTKNLEMEMALVKAQLDPHFLFNSLSNIDVLILKNPEEASIYLNKLSDIMRFMLFETKGDKIEIKKEIEYIRKFVDLQKIRSSNPEFVKLNVVGNSEGRTIAPMLLIPFIENAFKHVSDKQKTQAIAIELLITDEKIQFKCTNSNSVSTKQDQKNGLGNQLIKKRLDLLYPNSHQLFIDNKSDSYTVILSISNEQ